jgi:O-antigen ligase
LLVVAVWTAWRPAETVAATAVATALAVLLLVPWAHQRSDPNRIGQWIAAGGLALLLGAVSGLSGWDQSTAVVSMALCLAVLSLVWLASREAVPESYPRWLALAISLLALWALWQTTVGFDRAHELVSQLPPAMQDNANERLASGRAFASLILPGHLAAILATALPILASGVRRSWSSVGWVLGCVLCVVGLFLSFSPIGIALGVAALGALAARRRHWVLYLGAAALTLGIVAAFAFRGDLAGLEPLALRLDNWRTALWLWSTSPVTGVGFGSFGQACQTVPFAVGNRPMHAHSLPLEWLAELGIVGLVACILIALWMVRLIRRLWPDNPGLAVAIAVVPLHNLVDFSLFTSGVAVPWAVLVGWAASRLPRPADSPAGLSGRIVLVAVAASLVAVTMLHATSVVVERSGASAADGIERFDAGIRAHRLAPWRIGPVFATTAAALASPSPERLDTAAGVVEWGRGLRPHSASLAGAAGRLELARGRIPSALTAASAAAANQPFSRDHREYLERILEQLDASQH